MARLSLLTLTLGLFISSALGARLLGSEKCTWGPSYWCSGLQQAAGCRATNHCISKVWAKNPYPVDDDDVCTICKNMVGQARDQLQSNETQEELKEVFEGSCNLIPIKVIAAECRKLSDEFVPELVETLASEMNPDTVCSVAGLCNSKRVDKLLNSFKRTHPPTNCDMCLSESRKMSLKIREMDQDDLVDKALDVCNYVPKYGDACKSTILDNFDTIYRMLTSLDDGLCDMIAVCNVEGESSFGNELAVVGGDDVPCQFCTKVIQHWIDVWTSNLTEAQFKEVLEALCHKLHDEREAECLHIVDDYYLPFFNFLAHQVNPRYVCSAIGICNDSASNQELMNELPYISAVSDLSGMSRIDPDVEVTIDDVIVEQQTVNALVGGYFLPQTVELMNKPGCAICEYVIHELEVMLKDNKTKASIEEAMDKICTVMPASVKEQCNNMVDLYGRAVIELLANGFPPKQVCTMIQLCDNTNLLQETNIAPEIQELRVKNDQCATCEYTLNFVFKFLRNKDNRDEIRNVLETICSKMPSSIADRCETFMHERIDNIIELIVENLSAEEICSALSMCTKEKPKVQTEMCVLCEYIVQTLETQLQNKTERDEVKAALDKLCTYLPATVSKECLTFVNQYADMIIDFIVQGVTPEQICIQLHLCDQPKASKSLEEDEVLLEASILANEAEESTSERPYCLLCEYAISEVQKLLEDKQNEEEIKSVLDKICNELGAAPIQAECLKMIDKYTDKIIELIVKDYTPEQICIELRLCKPQSNVNVDVRINEIESQAPVKFLPGCILCEFVMSVVEKHILTNSTLDMVERAVLMVCSVMPNSVEDQCEDFVNKYGDEIVKLIIQGEMNPEAVCSALMLCSETTLWDASPVGGQPCPWGPAFWCQSPIHAQACGTFDYCKRNGVSFDD